MQRDGRLQEQARYTFLNEERDAFTDGFVTMRGDALVIMQGTRCYRVSLPDLMR